MSSRGRRPLRRLSFVLLLLLLGSAHAKEKPKPTLVDRVFAAHAAQDKATLETLALKEGGGIWLLVERTQQRAGGHEAALALAAASKDADHDALLRYAHSRKGRAHPAEALATVREAVDALGAKRSASALLLFGEARLDPESVFGIDTSMLRVRALLALERPDEALEALKTTADNAERIGWRWQAARALRHASRLAREDRDFIEAQAFGNRRYNLLRGRGDVAEAARELSDLANLCAEQCDYEQAKTLFLRAIEEHEAYGSSVAANVTRANLGHMYARMDEFAEALSLIERALAAQREAKQLGYVVDALTYLGSVRQDLGQLDKALEYRAECIKIAQELVKARPQPRRRDWLRLARAVGNRGITYLLDLDFAAAEADLLTALDLFETELKSPYGVAVVNANLAELYLKQGKLTQALRRIRGAIRWFEEAFAQLETTEGRVQEGQILAALRRHEEALTAFAVGRDTAKDLRAYDLVVSAMVGEARLRLEMGEGRKALSLSLAAIEHLAGPLSHLAQGEGAAARASRLHVYETAIRAAQTVGDRHACFEALESGRAGQLLDTLGGRAALQRVAVSPELQARWEAARSREAKAVARANRATEAELKLPSKVLKERRVARKALNAMSESFQRQKKQASNLIYPKAAPIEEVEACLAGSDALVEYSLLPGKALALVVTRAGPRIVELPSSKDIRAACAQVVEDPEGLADKTLVKELIGLLVEPLKLGKNVKRVLVSPDGVLTYVPFAMLLPDRNIAYVPSGSVYYVLDFLDDPKEPRGEFVLAVGDPKYAPAPTGVRHELLRSSGRPSLPRLKFAGEESNEVGDRVLLREQATKSNLIRALQESKGKRLRALHLAVHGFANERLPILSNLALAPEEDDEGFLTALDLFELEVHADLVVLSACDSAVGQVVRGEGLLSLVRAFMFAGAPRVLASLWKVEDEATCEFMKKFYRLWNPKTGQGVAAATALKDAQTYMREKTKWKHPRYWAAWVLWGLP